MASGHSSLGLLAGYSSSDTEEDETVVSTVGPPSTGDLVAGPSSELSLGEGKKPKLEQERTLGPVSPSCIRFPAPALGSQNTSSFGGVFSNQFHAEQQTQLSILEKHVKLSDSNWSQGRGACLAYQKDGRCRYGTRCKYSHGSDLPQENAGVDLEEECNNTELRDKSGGDIQMDNWRVGIKRTGEHGGEEEVSESLRPKKKKSGLTNTLLPPKRYLKNYNEHLANERPWTL
ncbi:hypothetical protein GDO86_013012 [Hymenochirus boettgeri]|uniref:C3H1-type domain-containing protein n=1 Tax=Hymenochirus boettgeri TaxID=247094 RepID=A0A8T2IV17_9PIPI|nr:hypothetical protein GDO86_013012 [Hymenochirus boettgeri]